MPEANNIPKETNLIFKNHIEEENTGISSKPEMNDRSIDLDLSEIQYETDEEITFGDTPSQENDSQGGSSCTTVKNIEGQNETDEEITFGDPPIQANDNNQGDSSCTSLRDIEGQMNLISGKLDLLEQDFNQKLKYDQQKDSIIDNLHTELQEYKNDTFRKHFQTMIMDVVKIIDDIRKLSRFYRAQESINNDPNKLLKLIESIPGDLEDSFYWQGVKPYKSDSDRFDPTRQKVLKKIETDDKTKDKTIADRLFPGYEWDGRVIRPEMVNVYLYVADSQEINFRSTDE